MEAFGLNPSKEVGEIKEVVREAIINGDIPNDFDAAYQYMLVKAAELGLTVNKPKSSKDINQD